MRVSQMSVSRIQFKSLCNLYLLKFWWHCSLLCLICFAAVTDAEESVDLFSLSLEELASVTVESASKREERAQDVPAEVIIITEQDIKLGGYSTLTDVLTSAHALYNIYQYSESPGNFGNRGIWNPRSSNSNMVFLIDGTPQTRADDRTNRFSKINLPVDSISRIEIILGPMSVIYGNGAFTGVVNIITKVAANTGESFNQLSLGYGSNSALRGAVQIAGAHNDVALSVVAGAYDSKGLSPMAADLFSPQTLATLPSVGVTNPEQYSLSDRLELNNEYLQLRLSYKEFTLTYQLNEADNETYLLFPPVESGTTNRSQSRLWNLDYEKQIHDELTFTGRISYEDFSLEQSYDALFPGLEGINQLDYQHLDSELVAEYQANEKLNIVFGAEFRKMSDFLEFTDVPVVGIVNESVTIDSRITRSLFTQIDYIINEEWRVVAGYRFEKVAMHDRLGISFGGAENETTFGGPQGGQTTNTPRLALIHQLDNKSSLKLLYGVASKISNDRFVEAEEITTWEAIYSLNKENLQFNTSLFRNKLDNLLLELIEVREGGNVINRTTQGGESDNWGISSRLLTTFEDNYQFETSVTWQNSSDNNTPNDMMAYSPEWLVKSSLHYEFGDLGAKISLNYISNMQSQFGATLPNPDGSFGRFIGQDSGSNFFVNTNVVYDVWNDQLRLSLGIKNLFDAEIRYPNKQQNSELLDRGTLDFEREVHVSLSFSF